LDREVYVVRSWEYRDSVVVVKEFKDAFESPIGNAGRNVPFTIPKDQVDSIEEIHVNLFMTTVFVSSLAVLVFFWIVGQSTLDTVD
jgi:hypothetical protein